MDRARQSGSSAPPVSELTPGLGQIKWFGGLNRKTGVENEFGFIATRNGELFFHREDAHSPLGSLVGGADVVFLRGEGRKGPQARFVQALSNMAAGDLFDLLRDQDWCTPEETLCLLLYRDSLGPFELLAFRAIEQLLVADAACPTLRRFWSKFEPTSPTDPLYALAPDDLKSKICRHHFADFRAKLLTLFSSIQATQTSMKPGTVFAELDDSDERLAHQWTERPDNPASLAKMLSARAAEKAAKKFYEATGSIVEDVSIRQLDGDRDDWKTHDLLVDSCVAVDVKNARRLINGRNFYVEHTVAKFKLDRGGEHVRIAGILSPYHDLEDIREPNRIVNDRGEVVYIGETSRATIDRLMSEFSSDTFEVSRPHERTFPHWLFGYPDAWYRTLKADVGRLLGECTWPEEEHWPFVFNDSEQLQVIPALCLARHPLPATISSRLARWQIEFYGRLQGLLGTTPHAPTIFLAVLTDFLEKLVQQPQDFSPDGYYSVLFGRKPIAAARRGGMSLSSPPGDHALAPVGAIDPLGIVRQLVSTLGIVWQNRTVARLEHVSSFRFVGLGLLQGRERDRSGWRTILAYCGGMAYDRDESGEVKVGVNRKPVKVYGKCGNTPLVVGRDANCQECGKLVCGECGFCSPPCQERQFSKIAERAEQARRAEVERLTIRASIGPVPEWDDIPLDVYEDDLRRR